MTYDRGEGGGSAVAHAYGLLTGDELGGVGEMLEGGDPGYDPETERKYRGPLREIVEDIAVSVTGKKPLERLYAQP